MTAPRTWRYGDPAPGDVATVRDAKGRLWDHRIMRDLWDDGETLADWPSLLASGPVHEVLDEEET